MVLFMEETEVTEVGAVRRAEEHKDPEKRGPRRS